MSSPRESPGMRLACDECHIRKLRCSRDTTACSRCICNGIKCSYSPARKVGRRKKVERSSQAAGHRNGQRMQTLKSMGTAEVATSILPAPYEDPSVASFWANLSGDDEYGQLPWQGLWTLPFAADEAGLGYGDGIGPYDGIARPIGSESFANDDIWWGPSPETKSAYCQTPSGDGPTSGVASASEEGMGPGSLPTSSAYSSDTHEGASSEEVSSNIQRLANLQQDLFVHRTRMCDTAGMDGQGDVVDIDAVISVGQAILELTRSLFACFLAPATASSPGLSASRRQSEGNDDPARILLALTPSLLVVTTYNDILHLISRALHEIKATPMHILTPISHPPGGGGLRGPPQLHHYGRLYGKTLHTGRRDLDFPVRLIVSMTIIDCHLGPLFHILQLIRSRRPRQPSLTGDEEGLDRLDGMDSSCDMLAPSIEGLWSATLGLRQRVGKLIEQAKLVDTSKN